MEIQELVTTFLEGARAGLAHPADRTRAAAILERWAAAWQGPARAIEATRSHHGAFLHFNQRIGTTWCQVCTFHGGPKHSLSMRGPDPDRGRKSHKLRAKRLDASSLDALYEAWKAHPEARPAGHAVELLLVETPDETWEACLQEALALLKE